VRRRQFITLAGAAVGVTALSRKALAQQALARVPRIAWLTSSVLTVTQFIAQPNNVVFFDRLGELGYVNGKTLAVDFYLAPTVGEMPGLAAKAVASNPNLILCNTTPAAQAAKTATGTIPIVFVGLNDPVGVGLVASLARPGGNVTGNTRVSAEVIGKQLAVVKELLPSLRRLAVLSLPADASHAPIIAQMRPAAHALNIELAIFPFDESQDFATQLERLTTADVKALFILASQYFTTRAALLPSFQVRTGIAVTGDANVRDYGVLGYGASASALYRQAASYVDDVLKGTKPADLPVQVPTVFDLIVNLRAARAIGLVIPPAILGQATTVVE
jgi:putative ABC transport system substrate-binding protein